MGALNAQRQFGITTKNKAKTAEKLSSGYKINRAADDAAGLAISEKMRRQVRGLTQGVENTEAGVSMCQVADGALAEVHDMLQRINELSIQAANGTNSYSDRQAIQEEINQLLTEIDRVGETTSFNEHKIFKSQATNTTNTTTNPITVSPAISNLSVAGTPIDTSITQYTFDADATGLLINGQSIAWADVQASNGDTMESLIPNTYTASMNGVEFSFTVNDNATMDSVVKSLKEASVDTTVNIGTAIEAVNSVEVDDYITTAYLIDSGDVTKDEFFSLVGSHQFSADENGITWNGQTVSWSTTAPYIGDGICSIEERILAGEYAMIQFENGPRMDVYFNKNATLEGVINAFNGATFDIVNENYVGYDSGGVIVNPDYDYYHTKQHLTSNFWTDMGYDVSETFFSKTEDLEADIEFDATDVNNLVNTKATIANSTKTIEFELDDESKELVQNIIDNGRVVSANQKVSLNFKYGDSYLRYDITPHQDMDILTVFDNLKTAVSENSDIAEASTVLSQENLVINDITQGNIGNPPTTYSFNITQPKESVQNQTSTQVTTGFDTKWNLWIQSGCDVGDGIPLEIDRMNTKILGIDDLDVSTEGGADHAMTAVGEAIKKISESRSKIGAQQNRLEHTIDNENNIIENTTAAESRIRDADMAELMVKFSKENILEQVGQSMMAQANQTTQGVMSLLQ